MVTAATNLPTRIDLSELFRDAWRLARAGAVASACSVRLCLGNGLRMAWARARYALARRAAAQVLRERIAINDKLMLDVQAEIDAGWGIFARSPEELYEHMDRLHHHGIAMRAELAELEGAPVPQQAQQQQPTGGAPEPVEPDLSPIKGLATALVGRIAHLRLQGGEALYRVAFVSRWTSDDGAMERHYGQTGDKRIPRRRPHGADQAPHRPPRPRARPAGPNKGGRRGVGPWPVLRQRNETLERRRRRPRAPRPHHVSATLPSPPSLAGGGPGERRRATPAPRHVRAS